MSRATQWWQPVAGGLIELDSMSQQDDVAPNLQSLIAKAEPDEIGGLGERHLPTRIEHADLGRLGRALEATRTPRWRAGRGRRTAPPCRARDAAASYRRVRQAHVDFLP
jgi:hypothetical protein